mmetsp:Transcript_4801/g.6866  ORF Transcript_4801/g.6866 Transcript_4801/m.6866 type:complete len:483 (+) Transcript_4801:176-1624(+)
MIVDDKADSIEDMIDVDDSASSDDDFDYKRRDENDNGNDGYDRKTEGDVILKNGYGEINSMRTTTFTKTKVMDASSFLFCSPVTPHEVECITAKVREVIENAHDVISKEGYDAFRKSQKKPIREEYVNNYKNEDKEEVEGGMDTDDEVESSKIVAAKALEDSIIRGHPRRYQIALFELAKRQNTIVHLGTGQGKTLVALLLIRHLAPAFERGMQTLFLVPSIALAVQHTTTLMANLPYTVATACNASTESLSSRKELSKSNIVVATHGAFKDLLMHYGDMFSLSRVNLIVVDECHHATGNHAYASIFQNFYHRLPKHQRPRVLGLTASPLINVRKNVTEENLGQLLDELESRLDSKLASFRKDDNMQDDAMKDTQDHCSETQIKHDKTNLNNDFSTKVDGTGLNKFRAEERSINYHCTSHLYPSFLDYTDIGLHSSRIREFNQLKELYEDLGPLLTGIYSATLSREVSINRYDKETHEEFQR